MTDLEVDGASKSLVASWFGIQTSDVSYDQSDVPKQIKQTKNNVKAKHKRSEEVTRPNKSDKHAVSDFIGTKLSKKLKKEKHRKEKSKSEIHESNHHFGKGKRLSTKDKEISNVDEDDEEENFSKVTSVEKGRLSSSKREPVETHTIESLRASLADESISKSKRKRLKRKLHNFLEKEAAKSTNLETKQQMNRDNNNGSEVNEKSLSEKQKYQISSENNSSDSHHKNRLKINCKTNKRKGETILCDEEFAKDLSSKKMKTFEGNNHSDLKEKDHDCEYSNEQNDDGKKIVQSDKSQAQECTVDTHKRRKRKKVRSKQKNIKKDNRPEHMKPIHLRKKPTDL